MPSFLRNIENERNGVHHASVEFNSGHNVSKPVKSRFTFEFGIISLLVVVAGIVVVTGWLAYERFTSLVASVDEATRPDMQLLAMEKVLTNLSEAESAVKSYSITREDAYFTQFYETTVRTDKQIESLYGFLEADTASAPYLDSLHALVDEKFQVLNDLLILKNQYGAQQALEKFLAKVEQNAGADTSRLSQDTLITNKTAAVDEQEPEKKKKGLLARMVDNLFSKKKPEQPQPPDTIEQAVATPQTDTTGGDEQIAMAEINKTAQEIRRKEAARDAWLKRQELNLWEQDSKVNKRIRNLFDSMKEEGNQNLSAQAKVAEAGVAQTKQLIAAFCIVAALLLMIAAFIIFAYVRNNRRYRKALGRAKIKAEELANAKERFLANMSHEIRTPMNAIAGFSEQLGQSKLSRDQREQLDIVQKSADHLLHIVNDVLDLTKLRSGRLKLESIGFKPRDVVNEVVQLMLPSAGDKEVTLEAEVSSDVPEVVIGDPVRLRQVLLNLVGNSIKFTPIGAVQIKVELSRTSGKKALLQFSVMDTGVGIDRTNLKRIFEDFEQGEISTARYFGGTGLGLSITRMLIEAQNGTIEVDSEPGKGTTVSVLVPYKVGTAKDLPEKTELARETVPRNLKVLVVDDEPFNRKLLTAILEKYGMIYTEAGNGTKAVELATGKRFDIILMDARMPEIDGVEATRQIRKAGVEIPIVALTAAVTAEDKKAYESAGMNALVGKPFKEAELIRAISRLLEKKENLPAAPHEALPVNQSSANGKFDVKELFRLSDGDDQFFREMLETFITSARETLTKIQEAYQRRQWEEMADAAHRLCPPSRHLDAHDLLASLKEIERIGRSKKGLKRLEELVNQVEFETQAVISGIMELPEYRKQEA